MREAERELSYTKYPIGHVRKMGPELPILFCAARMMAHQVIFLIQ